MRPAERPGGLSRGRPGAGTRAGLVVDRLDVERVRLPDLVAVGDRVEDSGRSGEQNAATRGSGAGDRPASSAERGGGLVMGISSVIGGLVDPDEVIARAR